MVALYDVRALYRYKEKINEQDYIIIYTNVIDEEGSHTIYIFFFVAGHYYFR